jgi:hypothetical protein
MKVLLNFALIGVLAVATRADAQHGEYARPLSAASTPSAPGLSGQYAFATMAEIVRYLKADSTTDWTKVDIEKLRQHLIDMDDVMLRSKVVKRNVSGGLQMDVTGNGRTAAAIKRMVGSHAHVLDEHTDYRPVVKDIAGGVRLTVTAKDLSNASTVAMIRALGFAGIMVEGDHHAEHHLMMAKGSGHH